jgi:choline dehydrogenase-like flavoprotein
MDHRDLDGKEVLGVVDEKLQLKGFENIRISDASVIPHIPNFPIAKVVMIIGLRVGDFIHDENRKSTSIIVCPEI